MSDVKQSDIQSNSNLSELEQTERNIVQLLDVASRAVDALSSVDAASVSTIVSDAREYATLLQKIDQSLTTHIQRAPVPRKYAASAYADVHQLFLSHKKLELASERLHSLLDSVAETPTSL
jgi:Mediator complex protein